jgi:hypothetical protein
VPSSAGVSACLRPDRGCVATAGGPLHEFVFPRASFLPRHDHAQCRRQRAKEEAAGTDDDAHEAHDALIDAHAGAEASDAVELPSPLPDAAPAPAPAPAPPSRSLLQVRVTAALRLLPLPAPQNAAGDGPDAGPVLPESRPPPVVLLGFHQSSLSDEQTVGVGLTVAGLALLLVGGALACIRPTIKGDQRGL